MWDSWKKQMGFRPHNLVIRSLTVGTISQLWEPNIKTVKQAKKWHESFGLAAMFLSTCLASLQEFLMCAPDFLQVRVCSQQQHIFKFLISVLNNFYFSFWIQVLENKYKLPRWLYLEPGTWTDSCLQIFLTQAGIRQLCQCQRWFSSLWRRAGAVQNNCMCRQIES